MLPLSQTRTSDELLPPNTGLSWTRTVSRPRRALLPLALASLGLACALLVGGWPAAAERMVVTRRAHNADPLLSASILRFQVASLVGAPARFYEPPFLHPDPNPLRGTEPLLS